jgi:uncharacterized membrane protein YbhN (UPF0104 family)
VATLSVLGAVADLLVLVVLVFAGHWLGLNGSLSELGTLTGRIARLLAPLRSPWVWTAAAAVLITLAVLAQRRTARRRWVRFWQPARGLASHPRRLARLLAASGATTLVLGFAFVASTVLVPGPQPKVPLGALLIAFMIGAAAGSSVPTPAALGSTEAALAAVLVSTHVPAGHAIQDVLLFRLITFWAPAVIGIAASRRLVRSGAL